MAIIIFSDGSKRMAHNTDDLRERWSLSKPQEWERIVDEHKNGIRVPQFIPSDTYLVAEVLHFRRHMHQFRDELRRRVKMLKRHLDSENPQVILTQEAQWETNSNIAICNSWLAENSKKPQKQSRGLKKVIMNDTAITFTVKAPSVIAGGIQRWLDSDASAIRELIEHLTNSLEYLTGDD